MKKILTDKSFQLAIILTFIFLGTGLVFLFLGLATYSWILFVLLPIVLGISLGALPNKKTVMIGGVAAGILVLLLLIPFGLSGLLCALMSAPIIIPFMFIGSITMHLIRRYKNIKSNKIPVLIIPLLPFMILAPTEQMTKKDKENVISVKTEQVFNYTPEEVFDAIKSVDTLDAEKSWLMHLDLPVPVKCILEKEEVGAIRTCYFESGKSSAFDFGAGTITEKVTAIERGKILKMDVIDYQVVGRNWLGFKEAIYLFEEVEGNKCKLTRITTYTSVLSPRIYWEPLEKLGISQEHDYVFANLLKDLKNSQSTTK